MCLSIQEDMLSNTIDVNRHYRLTKVLDNKKLREITIKMGN